MTSVLTPHPSPFGRGWPFLLPDTLGIAAAWQTSGLAPGTRIALGPACDATGLAAIQAATLIGLTAVLINRRLPVMEMQEQLERALVVAAFADDAHPLRTLGAAAIPAPDDRMAVPQDGGALVLFTSGTTGRAKAARISQDALRQAGAQAAHLGIGRTDVWLACLPCDHIGGAMIALRSAAVGCAILAHPRFTVEAVAADLPRCTVISLVPTMLARLLDAGARFAGQVVLIGGGPLDPALAQRARTAGARLCQTYGLTEAASMVTAQRPGDADDDAGPAIPGMQVRIVDESGAMSPARVPGLIELRGDSLFAGYEDRGLLIPRSVSWFSTGDWGVLDGDGRLTVHCRRDDLIVTGGENVYPAQVEAALLAHPGIAEASVYPLPDALWGQTVAAACVGRAGPVPQEELEPWLRQRLAGLQLPRRWHWLDALPRNALGKVVRSALPGR